MAQTQTVLCFIFACAIAAKNAEYLRAISTKETRCRAAATGKKLKRQAISNTEKLLVINVLLNTGPSSMHIPGARIENDPIITYMAAVASG